MGAANDLLEDAYARVAESVLAVLEGLTPEDATWRPEGSGNSIGWLVWHLTRVLDDHLAAAAGTGQVLHTQEYAAALALDLPADDTGYGHSRADVDVVRFKDLSVLAEYHRAVQESAASYVTVVTDLDTVVDERWDPPVTLGVRLVSVVNDDQQHVGQAAFIRGLLNA